MPGSPRPNRPTRRERTTRPSGAHVWFTLLVSVAGWGLTGCDENESVAGGAPTLPTVSVTRPIVRQVTDYDVYSGRLEATQIVDVRSRVSGFLDKVTYNDGAIVQQDDLLFVIDVRPYQAELNRAEAEVARAEAQRRLAASEFERISSLRGTAASETEFFNARQAMESAEAAVAAGRAAVESARLNVEWCQVKAPISGRAGRRLVTPGNLITGGAGQATLLTTITSVDPIYCYVEVDERSVRRYQRLNREEGRPSAREGKVAVQLALSDEDEFRHEGHIDFVDNRIDPATGTIIVRGVFPNPTGELLPGFFARLRLPGRGPYEAVLVPEEAIATNLAQQYVLVVGPDDVVQLRPVTPGNVFNGLRAVEGIASDARVIVKGLTQAQPGVKVQPQEVPIQTAGESPGVAPAAQPQGQGPSRSANGPAGQPGVSGSGPGVGTGAATGNAGGAGAGGTSGAGGGGR